MTVYYGDSIAFGMANAEAAQGRPGTNLGIVGAGLLSEGNMTEILRGAKHVPSANLAPQGNLYDPSFIPPNQDVEVSFGYNDANTAMASSASRSRYIRLAADRLIEIAQRVQGQPITLLGLKHLANQNTYHISDATIDGVNHLLDEALKEARRRAAAQGIPFNGNFLDLSDMRIGRLADGLHYTPSSSCDIAARARGSARVQTPVALPPAMAPVSPASTSALSRDEIIQIQDLLRASGFDPGAIDGRQGKHTNEALQDALRAKGFNPGVTDGIMGRNTIAAISALEQQTTGANDGRIDAAEVRQLLNMPNRSRPPQARG